MNGFLVMVLLIGLPTITGLDMGPIRITAMNILQRLTLGGLALAILINLALVRFIARTKPLRCAGLRWAMIFSGLTLVELMVYTGKLDFEWLRTGLLWLQDQARSLGLVPIIHHT